MFYRGDCEPSLELPEPKAQRYPRGTNVRCRCWIWWSMASSFLPLRLVLHIYAKYPNNWGWIRFLRQIATPSQRIILRYQTQSSPICFCNLSSWTLATFYSLESLHSEYYASHCMSAWGTTQRFFYVRFHTHFNYQYVRYFSQEPSHNSLYLFQFIFLINKSPCCSALRP